MLGWASQRQLCKATVAVIACTKHEVATQEETSALCVASPRFLLIFVQSEFGLTLSLGTTTLTIPPRHLTQAAGYAAMQVSAALHALAQNQNWECELGPQDLSGRRRLTSRRHSLSDRSCK